MRSVQNISQMTLDEYLTVGDLTIDGSIKHGDITRFLASRVGDTGKVLAFSDNKHDVDQVATSLFLSGLNQRVDLISKDFSAIINYLDPTQPVGAALFQIDADTDQTALLSTIKPLLMALKKQGMILLITNDATPIPELTDYAKNLPEQAYDVKQFQDLQSGEQVLLLQRL
ncbi:hypothetical protein JOC36_001183 [Weissella uvarum]|uniref:rRNA methyltransferase n=1 Tax=Weissella uvarum TaxID=1479233 RepID=UPI001961CA26|nr:rRNA methyltransferase [Weissella uvarum]MBM7617621.1 hypothetical protein [Weissella uvarum]MCM0595971.1 rRNA methyltransferase [Weissella uvarum]